MDSSLESFDLKVILDFIGIESILMYFVDIIMSAAGWETLPADTGDDVILLQTLDSVWNSAFTRNRLVQLEVNTMV